MYPELQNLGAGLDLRAQYRAKLGLKSELKTSDWAKPWIWNDRFWGLSVVSNSHFKF